MKLGFVARARSAALAAVTTGIAMGVVTGACAESVPRSALDRCNLGKADGNDGYVIRQGAACAVVAQSLISDDKPDPALGFARKACELQDPGGCVLYLKLARTQPTELSRARTAGAGACDGMVVSTNGVDARPRLCALTGQLFDEVEPRSSSEAAHYFASACKLGDDHSCARARSLGVDPFAPPVIESKPGAPRPSGVPTLPPAMPPAAPTSQVASQVVAPACHEMRGCVQLGVQQHNANEVVGTIVNHCDGTVVCKWCPSKGTQIEKAMCHTGTLTQGETRAGQSWGLWYQGFDGMAYDCIQEADMTGCLAL